MFTEWYKTTQWKYYKEKIAQKDLRDQMELYTNLFVLRLAKLWKIYGSSILVSRVYGTKLIPISICIYCRQMILIVNSVIGFLQNRLKSFKMLLKFMWGYIPSSPFFPWSEGIFPVAILFSQILSWIEGIFSECRMGLKGFKILSKFFWF